MDRRNFSSLGGSIVQLFFINCQLNLRKGLVLCYYEQSDLWLESNLTSKVAISRKISCDWSSWVFWHDWFSDTSNLICILSNLTSKISFFFNFPTLYIIFCLLRIVTIVKYQWSHYRFKTNTKFLSIIVKFLN